MADQTRKREWAKVEAKLPCYLEALLDSEVFGRGPGRELPPREHGVYLFTETGRHLYVGRCGLTERAAKRGSTDVSVGHVTVTRPGRGGHNPPSFSIAREISASGE